MLTACAVSREHNGYESKEKMSHLDIIRFRHLVENLFWCFLTFSVSFNCTIYDIGGVEINITCISGCYRDKAGKMRKHVFSFCCSDCSFRKYNRCCNLLKLSRPFFTDNYNFLLIAVFEICFWNIWFKMLHFFSNRWKGCFICKHCYPGLDNYYERILIE